MPVYGTDLGFEFSNGLMWFDSLPLLGPGGLAIFLFFFSCGEDAPLGSLGMGMSQLPATLPNRKTEKIGKESSFLVGYQMCVSLRFMSGAPRAPRPLE